MKRLVLAGAALCCACFAQARVDLEYHAAAPKDNKVPEEYQKNAARCATRCGMSTA